MNKEKIMEKFDSLITNLKNWANSSMCETCHQPNQGGEGIEHDEGCPESDQQNHA